MSQHPHLVQRVFIPDASTNPISVCDLANADYNRNRPTFAQLRTEGLSGHAIETLVIARECIGADPTPGAAAKRLAADDYGQVARLTADMLRISQRAYPVDVDDVWPEGVPEHWQDWSCYDPTDAELEQAWTGPDAHEAHRAAWALHQETHDRSAS